MELRIDRLLATLRRDPAELLARIDADPLLLKRTVDDLVLANASKLLFTPQEPHQLFAKGIVYRRAPYELVSLPLLKIYNLGEREVTVHDVASIARDASIDASIRFLRKLDGTLIQRFQHAGRVWYTTRGMLEGTAIADDDESHFDFLGTARTLAANSHPILNEPRPEFDSLTCVFELLHPETRVVTNYGERQELVLLTIFDRRAWRYWRHQEVLAFAERHQLRAVDAYSPHGVSLLDQIETLRASWMGTDEEGTVIAIESADHVVYRVKVKSADYLRMLKLMLSCTYDRTAEMLAAHPEWQTWHDFKTYLQTLGADQVPEEVLDSYRDHYETYQQYLRDLDTLIADTEREVAAIRATILVSMPPGDERAVRKAFAAIATRRPNSALLFLAFDRRLTRATARQSIDSPELARDTVRNRS